MQLWSGPAIYMFDASKGYISHFFIWFKQTMDLNLFLAQTWNNLALYKMKFDF